MKLMGLNTRGVPTVVDVRDCPGEIARMFTATMAVPNSPLIFTKTMVYYDEERDIAEGDCVFINGKEEGVLFYSQGWRLHKLNGECKKISDIEHIKVIKGKRDRTSLESVNSIEGRRGNYVCHGAEEFKLERLYIYRNGEVGFTNKQHLIFADELYLSTGILYNKRVVGFDMFVGSGFVKVTPDFKVVIQSVSGDTIKEL